MEVKNIYLSDNRKEIVRYNKPSQIFNKRVGKTFAFLAGVLFMVIFAIYRPFKTELEQSLLETFEEISNAQYISLETSVNNKLKDAASLSGSRVTYEAIANYKDKQIDFEQLQEITQTQYEKDVESLNHLVKAQRFIEDEKNVSWAVDDEAMKIETTWNEYNEEKEQLYRVGLIDNYEYLVVYSPIKSFDEEIMGYDQLFFDFKEQIAAISAKDIDSQLIIKEEVKELEENADIIKEENGKKLLYYDDGFYQVHPTKSNVDYVTQQNRKKLFEPVSRLNNQVIFLSISSFVFYTFAVYLLLVRYAKKELDSKHILLNIAQNEADTDILTPAYSRRFGEKELAIAFKHYKENQIPAVVILFDIDSFKRVNDTYGHSVGDELVHQIASVVAANIRSDDLLIRWGGDEFIIFSTNLKPEDVWLATNRLLKEVAKVKIETHLGEISPTVSMGVSYFRDEDSTYIDAMNRADIAMYQSKAKGKNQINIKI